MRIGGEFFRFAVLQFGMRISNQGLASLLDPLIKKWRLKGHRVLCWVDNLLFVTWNECRNVGRCGGADGGCRSCLKARDEALRFEREVDKELEDLGLLTNEKNCGPAQVGAFLSLSFDTVKGVLFIDPEKAKSLAGKFEECSRAGKYVSKRHLVKLRGKLLWFSPCSVGMREAAVKRDEQVHWISQRRRGVGQRNSAPQASEGGAGILGWQPCTFGQSIRLY